MKVLLYKDQDKRWDDFVMSSQRASVYHLSLWKRVIENSFGHKTFYLMAENKNGVKGVLPLTLFNSRLFGRFMVSLPYFNYGGICAEDKETMDTLLGEAIDIAKRENVEHIELRHSEKYDLSLFTKEKKVEMILELKRSPEEIWKDLDPKVRNQIRKAEKSGLKSEIAGSEGLDDFYRIFAINIRNLGTPVYSKNFFHNILKEFNDRVRIFIVYMKNKVIASSLVIGFKDKLEVPWAASLIEYRAFCPNMLNYWKMIEYACLNGYRYFDFGRSSWDSGTFKFKEQWGAKPKQLYWHYWLKDGNKLPEINPSNPKYKLAIKIWQKIPIGITNLIGPYIVKNIP